MRAQAPLPHSSYKIRRTVQFDDDLVAFLTGGISIALASRNASLVPSITRAKGCRVLGGSTAKLRLFVSTAQAGDFLDDIRSTSTVSATFTRPETHRTLQFKGTDARIDALDPADRQALADAVVAFGSVISPLGFPPDFVRAFLETEGDEVVVEFTPTDAFQQTPGPAAGERL